MLLGSISKSSRSRLYPRPNQHLLEIPKFPVASAGVRTPASTLNTTGVSRRLRTCQWNHLPPLTLSPQSLIVSRWRQRRGAIGLLPFLYRLRCGIRIRIQPMKNQLRGS